MTGGCQVACSQPSGAIFCDGSYLEVNNVHQCVDALNAWLTQHVQVDVSASGSAGCDGGVCSVEGEAQAQASASCSMARVPASRGGGAVGLGLGLGLLAQRVRRSGPRKR